jgi:DNA polymerase-3 subunit alpha
MSEVTKSSIPFVGLHAHSVAGSPYDGFGYPDEHMDFAYENGCDALALTDHGNMNGFSHQLLHSEKMKKQGKTFKPIFGVEAYFTTSIRDWKEAYEQAKGDKKRAKTLEKNDGKMSVENEGASKQSNEILKRRRHLVLLAQNQTGLNNIFKMVSESYQGDNFYRYPRIDYELLEKYNEGVIASSACLGGVYAGNYWENCVYEQYIDDNSGKEKSKKIGENEEAILDAMRETTRTMMSIFGDRWYGELQWNNVPEQHSLNKYIIEMHKEFGLQLISTADSHYPSSTAWKDRELYKRLGWIGRTNRPEWMSDELPVSVEELGMELYPKNGDQMWASYKKYSEEAGVVYDDDLIMDSITTTHKIAHERVENFSPDTTVRLPEFVVPSDSTADETLRKYSFEGLKSMRFLQDKTYLDRIETELDVIADRGFSKYFLTMKAVADKSNDVMLTGPGRGSAAGSLVAYVLGITQIDPIQYGLLFERFLRKDTTDYPDIDFDVADPMEIKEHLMAEWGKTTVVPISNFNTLQLRSLIKDISKHYNVPFPEVNFVTSRMIHEATPEAKKKHGIKSGVYIPTFQEIIEYSTSLSNFFDKYPYIKTHVESLYGQVKAVSRHAGGVVIGEDLDRHMPLIQSGGVLQTPWSEGQNLRHLEPLGFIKFDILGLSTLRMIDSAIGHILKRHHGVNSPGYEDIREFYNNYLHPDVINLDDKKVYKNIFQAGKFAGVFQFTQKGAQDFCTRAQPDNIIDLSAITSIYRPGPLGADVDKLYVKAKGDPAAVKYLHPIIEEVTKETYGFLIFQEQIALLAHKLGKDISLDEANLLRKLLTKKGTGKGASDKKKIEVKFIDGCVEHGLTEADGRQLWQTFEYFSGYGFNKSHAVSYSVLSFQCAWLLNYYPAEWMAAFLDKEPEGRKEEAINIAKRNGFMIRPLDVNTSGMQWEIVDDGKTLVQPLSSIKGLGEKAIEQIIDHRPFNSVEELLFSEDVSYSKLNKKSLSVLALSTALDSLVDDRFVGLKHFWTASVEDRPKNLKQFKENIDKYKSVGEFSNSEKIENITNLTGIFPFDLVLEQDVLDRLYRLGVPPLGEWDNDLGAAWFVPREVIRKKTKNGKTYWIIKTTDTTSTSVAIKCWGIRDSDQIILNHPYMAKLDYDDQWGFSTRSIRHNFRLLG